jgi:hypothetical protein
VVLQLLGVVLVFATVWAALQIEGAPMDGCAGDGADSCAGTTIPSVPQVPAPPAVVVVASPI